MTDDYLPTWVLSRSLEHPVESLPSPRRTVHTPTLGLTPTTSTDRAPQRPQSQSTTRDRPYPTTQDVKTQINPGMMNEWLITYFPMRVVPDRSKPMAAKSLG
jgi:hypothetical protein